MISDCPIISETRNKIAYLTFNRAHKHHAFDDVFIKHFTDILNQLKENHELKAIVIQSTGKSFSSGADLEWMKKSAQYRFDENHQDAVALDQLLFSLSSIKIPTVAVVQGNCFGGALGIISCCDIVICSNQAQFCFSEAKLGLIPAVISPYVVRAIGQRIAQKLFLTAEVFDAQKAYEINLCHEIVAPELLSSRLDALLELIQKNSPNALKAIHTLFEYLSPLPNNATRDATTRAIATIRASQEAQEGMDAFFNKRKPNWIPHD